MPGQLYHIALQILHQVHIKATHLQELESLVPLAHRLEFEAVEILVVVVGQLQEDLPVLEEVLEDPAASCLEHGDSLALGDHIEGVGLQGESLF